MTVTICEIHGRTGSVLVSSDIYELFLANRKPLEKYYRIKAKMFNREVNFCWLSSSFAKQFNIAVDEILSFSKLSDSEEEFMSFLVPICGKCFREWINQTGDEPE